MLRVSTRLFSERGHRQSYLSILTEALGAHGLELSPPCNSARADFFPMIEDNILQFAATAVVSSIRRRPCVGLLFRPSECLRADRPKYLIKGLLFRCLKSLPFVSILTILPFSVDNRFAQVATAWIHDPQLWDLDPGSARSERSELADEVTNAAQGRKTVVALGAQNRIKGFDYFARLWCEKPSVREKFFFVAAGKVSPESSAWSSTLSQSGGLVLDRHLSDEEFLGLYGAADLVWSCYAPDYNQASGIFGRAFQLQKQTIVREGSHLVRLGAELQHPVVAIPYDDTNEAVHRILSLAPSEESATPVTQRIRAMRDRDLEVLISAFNGRLS